MKNIILKKIYYSFLGKLVSATYNNFFSFLHKPRMLWGHLNQQKDWKENTRISSSTVFYEKNNTTIEDHVYIGHYCILDGTGGITIEEGVQISSRVAIYTHSSHIAIRLYGYNYTKIDERNRKGFFIKPVKIGRFAYIGTNATILSGVTIAEGALIAAGSVVKNDVGAFQCVAGSPARVIGNTKKMDKKYLTDPEIRQWYKEWSLKSKINK